MEQLTAILINRAGQLHIPAQLVGVPDPQFASRFDVDLLERGWVIDPAARDAISGLSEPVRTSWADWLLLTLESQVGADRFHVPLFRGFPETTPVDTDRLYIQRVLAFSVQEPDQPCILCGTHDSVQPVSPCGHLVCRTCFDRADYSACPICNRRIDVDDPFLQITPDAGHKIAGAPLRLRRLVGRNDRTADAIVLRDSMVSRRNPLNQAARDDLAVLIGATTQPGEVVWIPATVPVRETLAFVLATAVRTAMPDQLAVTAGQVALRWGTVTDIARTIWSLSGHDPGLVLPTRPSGRVDISEMWRPYDEPKDLPAAMKVGTIARPVRREIMAAIQRFDLMNAVEDMLRHATIWKRIGERLHPYQYADRYPAAAVCFAALRQTTHRRDSSVGQAIWYAAEAGVVEAIVQDQLIRAHPITFASAVQKLIDQGDIGAAARLLSTRPGDLLRHVDHIARIAPDDVQDTWARLAGRAALSASPLVALAAFAAVSQRDQATAQVASVQAQAAVAARAGLGRPTVAPVASNGGTPPGAGNAGSVPRVYFPRGQVMKAWSGPDRRPLLIPGAPDRLRASIIRSLQHRAALMPRFDIAVVDSDLAGYPIPGRTQTAAGSSRTIPRGSKIALPTDERIRLFLHWVQPDDKRVDLDLSVAFYDAAWQHKGHCDYTRLRFPGAIHSGDLTSAPAPVGATEYVDLDLGTLRANGVVYAVPVVFSFTDTAFQDLSDAFAGFSVPTPDGKQFDAARVAIRFDLVGDSRIVAPMTVCLADMTMRWADLHLTSHGYGHNAMGNKDKLALAGSSLEIAYGLGRRPSLLDLAAVHATTRAQQVWVRDHAGMTRQLSDVDFNQVTQVAGVGSLPLPDLDGRRVLFVAADHLPSQVQQAGPGSVLISATSGDSLANGDIIDLAELPAVS